MRNDIYLLYRSISRPDPLWIEQALYGGYTHIEVCEGIWCPRLYEYAIMATLSSEMQAFHTSAKQLLQQPGVFFKPSVLQQSNYSKLKVLLHNVKSFAIQGFSYAAKEFFNQINYTIIYSDADYGLPGFKQVSTEQLCKLSRVCLTLVGQFSTDLKSELPNWGNVIVYTDSMFTEDNVQLQLGGDYGITTY